MRTPNFTYDIQDVEGEPTNAEDKTDTDEQVDGSPHPGMNENMLTLLTLLMLLLLYLWMSFSILSITEAVAFPEAGPPFEAGTALSSNCLIF